MKTNPILLNCLIRYLFFNLGSVDGTKGDWIGIDWDDPSRGKHDGSHKGNNYFSTKTETSGSFVRITKVSKGRIKQPVKSNLYMFLYYLVRYFVQRGSSKKYLYMILTFFDHLLIG